MTPQKTKTRDQKLTIVYGMLCFAVVLTVLQLWLLTATMNAFLGGEDAIIWPVFAASFFCFALNCGLLRYLYSMEKA